MATPKVNEAAPLDGTEWQLLIQGGKLTRAQINAVIAFARKNYSTDNLPEGTTRLYFTNARAVAALADALSGKADRSDLSALVVSVNGRTGAVTLSKADVGLNNVNNTADANKPVSNATQAALDLKADKSQIVPAPVSSVNSKTGAVVLAKSDVGLGNADNTADMAKPISTAQQAALDQKTNIPGAPSARTVVFGTAYQATDKTKTALISVMVETIYTVTLAGTQSDTVELRVGPDAATVANGTGGTAIATFKSSLTGIAVSIGMSNTQRNQLSALIPPNWYFCLRRVTGTTATVQGAFDQAL